MSVTSPTPSPEYIPQSPFVPEQPKRRNRTFIVAAIVGVVVVAAAAAAIAVGLTRGSTGKPAAKQETRQATSAPIYTAPPVQTATVQQYASAVSPPIKALRQTYSQYQANGCLLGSGALACSLQTQTLKIEAETLAVTITGAAKEGVPAYIGQPPAEIKKLVGDTLYAAQDLDETVGPDGKYEAPILFTTLSRLMTTLDRWDPYLG
jgi:hypothetical protein